MIVLDTVIVLGVCALLAVGAGALMRQRSKTPRGKAKKSRWQGQRNAEEILAAAESGCIYCGKRIDPEADCYSLKVWWCKRCFTRERT